MNISKLRRPPMVPIEYAGKWVAWDHDETRVVASGKTFAEAVEAAERAGEKDPVMQKLPKANVHIVGGLRP
jgi:Family of unknown function (DUF5678)